MKLKAKNELKKTLFHNPDSASRVRAEQYARQVEDDKRKAFNKRPLSVEEKAIADAPTLISRQRT